jgi:hypothetical protein
MASLIKFFEPVDLLALNTLLDLEGTAQWLIQSNSRTASRDLAKGLNGKGDVGASKEHNKRESRTFVYECQAETGELTLPLVGTVTLGGWHIDSVKLDYAPSGWPKLTVQAHRHTGATNHTAGSCRTYSCTLSLPAQFGVPTEITDLTDPGPVTIFSLDTAAVAMRSLSYGLSVTHLDETGGTGDWQAGENRAGLETLDAQFLGTVDADDLTVGAGWHQPADGDEDSNQAAGTASLSLQHDVQMDEEKA